MISQNKYLSVDFSIQYKFSMAKFFIISLLNACSQYDYQLGSSIAAMCKYNAIVYKLLSIVLIAGYKIAEVI